jgi:hypothetical protein
LTSLLRPDAPAWLRPHLSGTLSLLPVRDTGVRQTIEFITSRSSDATIPEEQPKADPEMIKGPRIHLDAVIQASRLLSAVPSSLTPAEYFGRIGPQLLSLLDGEAGPELSRVAGYVIGSGILGRKSLGSPGTAGWKAFAEPMLSRIDPERPSYESLATSTDLGTLVSELDLDLATRRLATLFHSHPNPALARRLLRLVILPLWGLLVFSKQNGRMDWYERARFLVYTYYGIAADPTALKLLSIQLIYDGGKSWIFAPGSEGGIEIRRRLDTSDISNNMMDVLSTLDIRIDEFLRLASSNTISDSSIGPVFASVIQEWLQTSRMKDEDEPLLAISGSNQIRDPFTSLVNARLLQGVLDRLKERLARSPTQILELVKDLSTDFVRDLENANDKNDGNSTYRGLGRIVSEETEVEDQSENDPAEVMSVAISLLSAVFSSSEFKPTIADDVLISSIQGTLASPIISASEIPITLSTAISNVRLLLEIQSSTPTHGHYSHSKAANDIIFEDRKTFALSQTYTSDSLPPIRAQGLTLLQGLIEKQSPVIDVPVTTILLLSLLQDTEEYIYLFAIRLLALLASKHPKSVIQLLTQSYQDNEETLRLDQRLRLGEALGRIVERLEDTFGGDTAHTLGNICLGISGRRTRRPKDAAAAGQQQKLETRKQKEAEEAWGGEVPSLAPPAGDDKLTARLAETLEGWQGQDDEEDVRIRASSLSVLGTAIETNVAGLGPILTSSSLDTALSILTLETGPEKAILRRAALLLILSVVKALDTAREQGRELGFGFAAERWAHVLRSLHYVEAVDQDDLVKGHARIVIEALEDWRVKALLGDEDQHQHQQQGNNSSRASGFLGSLAGLDIPPNAAAGTRRIEEIE